MPTYTYSEDNAGSVIKDFVRFSLADTASPWLFADEEIAARVNASTDLRSALVGLARAAYLRVAKKSDDMTLGTEKKKWGDRADAYKAMIEEFAKMPIPEGLGGDGLPAVVPNTGTLAVPDLTDFLTE